MFFMVPGAGAEGLPKEVRFGYLNGPRPWILGKTDKSFDQAFGVPVTWKLYNGGPDVLKALEAGEVDIARTGSVPVTYAVIRQVPLKIIALSGVIDTSERLVAKKSVKSVKGLENQTVATVFGSTSHYALLATIDVFGLDIFKVKIVPLDPPSQLAAWKDGTISAAYIWGPFWHEMLANDGRTLISSGELNKHGYYLFNTFVVSIEFAEKYPSLVTKFLQNYQVKLDEYNQDKEGSAQKIAEELGQDFEGVSQTLEGLVYPSLSEQLNIEWLGNGADTPLSAIVRSFSHQASFLAEQGEVSTLDIPDSFAPYIDVQFLRKASGR
jgi:taurine transport system substrate-binding protein